MTHFLKDFFFECGPLLVFIKFVTVMLLFYILVFWLWGMWNLNSLTGDQTFTPCIEKQSLNHWTTKEVPFVVVVVVVQSLRCVRFFVTPCWDHELLIAELRLKLKQVGKTTIPFRYDLNQTLTIIQWKWQIDSRFISDTQSAWRTTYGGLWHCTGGVIKTIPRKRNGKRQNVCLTRHYK